MAGWAGLYSARYRSTLSSPCEASSRTHFALKTAHGAKSCQSQVLAATGGVVGTLGIAWLQGTRWTQRCMKDLFEGCSTSPKKERQVASCLCKMHLARSDTALPKAWLQRPYSICFPGFLRWLGARVLSSAQVSGVAQHGHILAEKDHTKRTECSPPGQIHNCVELVF